MLMWALITGELNVGWIYVIMKDRSDRLNSLIWTAECDKPILNGFQAEDDVTNTTIDNG